MNPWLGVFEEAVAVYIGSVPGIFDVDPVRRQLAQGAFILHGKVTVYMFRATDLHVSCSCISRQGVVCMLLLVGGANGAGFLHAWRTALCVRARRVSEAILLFALLQPLSPP